jgi:hypothetical protein
MQGSETASCSWAHSAAGLLCNDGLASQCSLRTINLLGLRPIVVPNTRDRRIDRSCVGPARKIFWACSLFRFLFLALSAGLGIV